MFRYLAPPPLIPQVIFVSDDPTQEAYTQYLSIMPWFAVPFDDVQRRQGLKYVLRVPLGRPALVILGPGDEIYESNGLTVIAQDPQGENYPWQNTGGDMMGGMMGGMGGIGMVGMLE